MALDVFAGKCAVVHADRVDISVVSLPLMWSLHCATRCRVDCKSTKLLYTLQPLTARAVKRTKVSEKPPRGDGSGGTASSDGAALPSASRGGRDGVGKGGSLLRGSSRSSVGTQFDLEEALDELIADDPDFEAGMDELLAAEFAGDDDEGEVNDVEPEDKKVMEEQETARVKKAIYDCKRKTALASEQTLERIVNYVIGGSGEVPDIAMEQLEGEILLRISGPSPSREEQEAGAQSPVAWVWMQQASSMHFQLGWRKRSVVSTCLLGGWRVLRFRWATAVVSLCLPLQMALAPCSWYGGKTMDLRAWRGQ